MIGSVKKQFEGQGGITQLLIIALPMIVSEGMRYDHDARARPFYQVKQTYNPDRYAA